MQQQEIWLQIKDFPRYYISNLGRVKSTIGKEKILKQYVNKKGYCIVKLSKQTKRKEENKVKDYKVHRLVAKHFCSNYRDDIEVHHINLKRTDNRAINLQCVTKRQHCEIHKQLKQQQKDNK